MQRLPAIRPAILFSSLLFVLLVISCESPGYAQLQGRIAERPIGTGYARKIDQVAIINYARDLSERLNIGNESLEGVTVDQLQELQSSVPDTVQGTAWYLVQGLIPTFQTVYFTEILGPDDARRILNARKKLMGDAADITDKGDGQYVLTMHSSWSYPADPNNPQQQVDQLNKQLQSAGDSTYSNSARLIEKEGKPYIEQSWSMQEYYRIHDELLFSARFEELFDMELPSRQNLTESISSENDMGLEVFFDRIPMAIRMLGWNMLNSTAGTQIQQRDDEAPAAADLRRSSMQLGLDIVRSALFNVEKTDGWIRFATDTDQNVRAEITFDARANSPLAQQLKDITDADSRFAPVLNDDAAATLHTCFRVADDAGNLARAAAEFLNYTTAQKFPGNPDVHEAVQQLANTVSDFARHRTVEVCLKAGWTQESGGVFYGGCYVGDRSELLPSLYRLMTLPPNDHLRDYVSFNQDDGVNQLHLRIPEPAAAPLAGQACLNLTDVFLVHDKGRLWFSAGGQNAIRTLDRCRQRCDAVGLAARTPLLTFQTDVARWLQYPQDEPVGIGGLLSWLDANAAAFPPSPVTFSWPDADQQSALTPLLRPCLDLGGEAKVSFVVHADKSGVRATAVLGEAIANYYLARLIDLQSRAMAQPAQSTEEDAIEVESNP